MTNCTSQNENVKEKAVANKSCLLATGPFPDIS